MKNFKNKIQIGIIGPGNHFENKIYPVLKNLKKCKVSGILRKKNIKFKNIKVFNDEKSFFKQEFDIVYISCPNKFHEKYVIKSLKSNFHVICEKPFLANQKKLNKIINLSKKKNKLIFEAFMYIFHPAFLYLKKLIDNNKFGTLKYVISSFRYPTLKSSDNKYVKNIGGGFFLDSASYLISLENYLYPTKFGFNRKILGQKIKENVDLRGNLFIKSNKFHRYYFWGEGQKYQNRLEVFFQKGYLVSDFFFSKPKNKNLTYIFFKGSKKKISFKNNNHFKNMFKNIFKNFRIREFQKKNRELIKKQAILMSKCYKLL